MGATGVLSRQISPVTFWQSTNGKKVIMAVTGCMMFLFVIGHMLGNLQMFEAPEHINAYGHFLHNLGELLWIERGIMLLAIALHITATVQLALPQQRHSPPRRLLAQAGYQLLLRLPHHVLEHGPHQHLAFIIFHLLQFTAGVLHPAPSTFVEGQVYANVVSGFKVWWVSAWYIFAVDVCLLGTHLSHGLWSMFQSVGLGHKRHTALMKKGAQAVAILIVLGYISIPISVLLGFIK